MRKKEHKSKLGIVTVLVGILAVLDGVLGVFCIGMVILLCEMEHSELEVLYLVFSYKNVRISFYILRVNFDKSSPLRSL